MSNPTPSRLLALVAEDEPLIMMETVDLLADEGFDVLEASNAEQALRLLAANPGVLLMITDVQMPGSMHGFALARKAHSLYPELSIVVCSGQLKPNSGELPALALFVDKPLSGKVLGQTLRKLNRSW